MYVPSLKFPPSFSGVKQPEKMTKIQPMNVGEISQRYVKNK